MDAMDSRQIGLEGMESHDDDEGDDPGRFSQ